MDSIFGENDNVDQQTGLKEHDPQTLAQLKGGANWFYWIAGLSLINSAIFAFGGEVNFIAGLAYTQIIDAIFEMSVSQGAPTALRGVAIVMDLILVAIFALFGYFANKAINAVFIVGMVVYFVDGIIWLLLGSYFAAGFHVFALIMIGKGFMASREVAAVNAHNAIAGRAISS